MNREEIIDRLRAWIAEITQSAPVTLTADTDLVKDVGLDSLALAELAAKVRTTLGIRLRAADMHNRTRLAPLVDLLEQKLAARA